MRELMSVCAPLFGGAFYLSGSLVDAFAFISFFISFTLLHMAWSVVAREEGT